MIIEAEKLLRGLLNILKNYKILFFTRQSFTAVCMVPIEGVKELVAFMKEFENKHKEKGRTTSVHN
jgi:phosphoserine aminotransferase